MSGSNKKWVAKKEPKTGKKDEGPSGPSYAKANLLGFYNILKTSGLPDDFKLGYKTEERPEEKADDDKSPEEKRKALQDHLKSQKQAKAKAKTVAQGGKGKGKGMMWPPVQQQWVPPMKYVCQTWGTRATVKLSNLPTSYSQEDLVVHLIWRFRGALDFVYVPEADEGSAEGVQNQGHAFLNFRVPQGTKDFVQSFNDVLVSTAFPGSVADDAPQEEKDKKCAVEKVKSIADLDNALENLRESATSGKVVRFPVLLDILGYARPLPAATPQATQAAALAAVAVATKVAAAMPQNSASSELRKQIEYYFSFDNMCRDIFLRNQMDEEGWVPMSLIAGFKRVQAYGVAAESLGNYLENSDIVEVDNEKHRIRQKDVQQRLIWDLSGAVSKVDKKDPVKSDDAAKSEKKS